MADLISPEALTALFQVILLDRVLARDNAIVIGLAGAAREHPVVLVFGLALSIALMGLAASLIARVLQRHRWIAYVGLAVILYVALEMVYRGLAELRPVIVAWAGI